MYILFMCVKTKKMKAFTFHDFKVARFTDTPCTMVFAFSVMLNYAHVLENFK
jgi:hypothetical protein